MGWRPETSKDMQTVLEVLSHYFTYRSMSAGVHNSRPHTHHHQTLSKSLCPEFIPSGHGANSEWAQQPPSFAAGTQTPHKSDCSKPRGLFFWHAPQAAGNFKYVSQKTWHPKQDSAVRSIFLNNILYIYIHTYICAYAFMQKEM